MWDISAPAFANFVPEKFDFTFIGYRYHHHWHLLLQ